MTAPNLLDELEGVVAKIRATTDPTAADDAATFIETHHATLADMAKRLEAAERDARRYRFIESAPSGTVRADFVSWLPAYFHFGNGISLGEQLDAAIDATQESEG